MNEVPTNEMLLPKQKSYYQRSTSTELRVVFDGSAKTTSGISLNDRLMVGPEIQKDLFSILIGFRMYRVALSADIAKMYRQVQLDAEDKDYHRLLWKEPNSIDIKTLRMTRVTYGTASSAIHSVRPLQGFSGRCYGQKSTARNYDRHVRRRLVDRSTRYGKCNETAGLNQSSSFRSRV